MQKKPPKAKISSSPPTMQSPSLLERIKNLSTHQQPKLAQTTSFTSDRVKGRVRSNFSEYFDARKIQFNHTLDNLRSSSSKRKHFYDEKPEPDDAIWTLRVENETQKKQLALLTDLNQKLQKNLAQIQKDDQSADNQNLNKLLQGYQKKAEERKSIMKQLYGILKTKDQELEYLRSAHEKQVKQLDSKMTQLQQLFDHQMIQSEDRVYKLEFKVRELKGYRQNKLQELTIKEDKMKEILFRLVKKSESNEKINEVKGILAFIQKEKLKLQPDISNDYQKLADIHESYINHIEALNQELAQFINQQELNPMDVYNKNLSEKLNNQVAQLSQNITYLTQQLQSAEQKSTLQEAEIEVLEMKNQQLQEQLQQMNNQNNTLIQERQQLIDKIQLIHQDSLSVELAKTDKVQDLSNQIKQFEKANNQLKNNNEIMKSEIQQQSQLHTQELNTLNQTIRQQIHDFQNQKIQLNKYQYDLQQLKSQDQIVIEDLSNQIQVLKDANTKLKQELNTTNVFNKNLSEKFNNQLTQSTQSVNHLRQQLQSVESKSIELENEIETLEQSNQQLQDQIKELEHKNNTFIQNRQQYIDQIELLKRNSKDIDEAQLDKVILSNQLEQLQESNVNIKNQNELLQHEIHQQSQIHIQQLATVNESNRLQSNEFEKLKLQLQNQQLESQQSKQQDKILIQELNTQLHLLKDSNSTIKQQLFNLQNQLLESQNQSSRFQEELQDSQQTGLKLTQQLVSLEDQCKQLRAINNAQIKEADELKIQIAQLEQCRQSTSTQIQQQLNYLQDKYSQQQKELKLASQSNTNLEQEIIQKKEQISNLCSAEQSLSIQSTLYQQSIDQLSCKNKDLEEKIAKLESDQKQEQNNSQKLQNTITQYEQNHKKEIQTLETQNNKTKTELEQQITHLQLEITQQSQDWQLQLTLVLNENNDVKGDYLKLNKQLEDLNEDYLISQIGINQYKNMIDRLKAEIDSLNSQCLDSKAAQSNLFEQNTSLQSSLKQEGNNLKEQIDSLKSEIVRLFNECQNKDKQMQNLEKDQLAKSDILQDLSNYVKQLEKSNNQLKNNNEIMKSEIQQQSQLHTQELNIQNQTIRQLNNDFQNQKIQFTLLLNEENDVKSDYLKLNKQLEDLNEDYSISQRDINQYKNTIDRLKAEIESLNSQFQDSKAAQSSLLEQNTSLQLSMKQQGNNLEEQIDSLESERVRLFNECQNKDKQIQNLEKDEQSSSKFQPELETQESQLQTLLIQQAADQTMIMEQFAQLTQVSDNLTQCQLELTDHKTQIEQTNQQLQSQGILVMEKDVIIERIKNENQIQKQQIDQLTDKLKDQQSDYELGQKIQQQQLNTMKQSHNIIVQELENIKEDYDICQRNINQLQSQIRQLNEDKLKIISDQNFDYQQQLDQSKRHSLELGVKISDLSIENQRLCTQIGILISETSSIQKTLESQISTLELQLVNLKNDNNPLNLQIKALNDQLQEADKVQVQLKETNHIISGEKTELKQQIEDLKKKLENSEIEHKNQISEQQKYQEEQLKLKQDKLDANYELSELSAQQDEQMNQLTHDHKTLIINYQELHLKIKDLDLLNQKHITQIENDSQEIVNLKSINDLLQLQIASIQNEEIQIKLVLQESNTENSSFKEQINKYVLQLSQLQQYVELLSQEKEKETLNKNKQIEVFDRKVQELDQQNESLNRQIKDIQTQIESLNLKNQDLVNQSFNLQADKLDLQQQFDQLEVTLQVKNQQIQQLNGQIETLQEQLTNLQLDSNLLKQQIEANSNQNTQYQDQIQEQACTMAYIESNLKDKYLMITDLEEKNTKSQEQLKQLEDQMEERQQDYDLEKTILQKQINQYQQESSKVYNDYLDILDQFEIEKRNTKVLQNKVQNLDDQIENQNRIIEQLKMAQEFLFAENNQQNSDQIQKYQNKIQLLQDQLQQTEQNNQSVLKHNTELKEENVQSTNQLVELQNQHHRSLNDLLTEQHKVQKLTQEKEMITTMLIKNEEEINLVHTQLKSKDEELKKLNQELTIKQDIDKTLKLLQIACSALELELASNTEEIKKQKKMYSELSDQYELLQQRNLQSSEQQSILSDQLQQQEELIKQLKEEINEYQVKIQNQVDICNKHQEEIQTLEQQIELQSSDYNTIQQQLDEEKLQVEQLQNTILEKEEDIQRMRDLVERLEINQIMKHECVSQNLSVPQLVVSRVDKSFMKDSNQMSNNPMDEDEPMNRSFVENPLEDDVSGNPIIAVVSQNLSQHFNIGSSVKEDQQQIINNLQEQITQLFEENNRLRLNELQMVGSQKHRVLILEEQLQKMRDQIMSSDFVSDPPDKEPANAQESIHLLKEKVSSLELDIQLSSFENDELKQELSRMKLDIDRSGLQVATLNKSIKLLQEANASLHHHKNGVIQSPPSQPKEKIKGDHIVNVLQKVLQNDEDWKLYLQFTGLEGKILQDFRELLVQIKPQEDVNLLRKQLEREIQQRESIARDLRQTLQDKQNLSQQFIEFRNQISSQRVSEQGSALKDPSEIDEEDNLRQLISKLKRETEQTRKENLQLRQQLKSQDDDEDKYSHQQRLLKEEIKSQRTQLEQLMMDNKKLVDLLSNSEDAAMAGHLSSLLAKFFEAYVKENKQDLIVYYKSLVSMLGTAQRDEFINKLCASLDKKKTSGVFGKIFQ